MFKQTIALFHYQLLSILNIKMMLLMVFIYVAAFLSGQFVAQLAIINSDSIALGVMADFLRYSLAFLLIISLSYQVSQDYEISQFDRLLAMPISRGLYILAQNVVLLFVSLLLIIPVFLLMTLLGDVSIAGYWSLAVFLELVLIGQFALLAILSLEKLPIAVIFTLAIYLLTKSAPLLDLIFSQSVDIYEEERGFQLGYSIFSVIRYVLPDASAFAQNNVLFNPLEAGGLIFKQLTSVVIYGLFIQFVILIDFYRKEFNQA